MSDNKKYYYLKLKENFFDSDSLIILESMPDGYLYSNILLKLYLRSLKNEGKLMFNERIPYNPTVLAQITRHSVGVMEKALDLFKEMELIEVLDNGAIFISDIQNFIGESSTEADRKRLYRARIQNEKEGKRELLGQVSDKCPDKTPPEIEIETETDIDKEIEIDKETSSKKEVPVAPYKKLKELYNDICKTLPQIRSLSNKRKTHLKARFEQFDCDIGVFEEAFKKLEGSDFCKGVNERGWRADFDWLIKNDNNMLKVLEGRYDNTGGVASGKSNGNTQESEYRGGMSEESIRLDKIAREKGLYDNIRPEDLDVDF